jgi:FAD/FMN-containing dehydrogenase
MNITDHLPTELGIEDLEERLRAVLVLPSDPDWDQARQAWNLAVDQRPAAVALPRSPEDVATVVRYARARGLRVAPQGTGHNAAAIASLADTVLLRTSRMRTVRIDADARVARVEAGALWMDVTGPAGEHGLAALAGSSPDVGVVGYCLGGGVSWLGRRYGLASNSVLAVELVTADGSVVRATADDHPGLFWAVRGGGGSFGTVTALELALFPVAEVHAGTLFFPWGRAREVLQAWRDWTATVPETVTSCGRILQVPPLPDVPEPLRGRQFVLVEVVVLGDATVGDELVAPLRALEPEIDTIGAIPAAALSQLHMDPEHPVPAIGGGRLVRELPPAAVDALVEAAGPTSGTTLMTTEVRHLGGALGREPAEHGAVGSLPGEYMMFCGGIPVDAEVGAALARDVARVRDALAPWGAERDYLNFVEEPADVRRFFSPEVHARLRAVKRRYDPEDRFLANHPIRPA